MFDPNEQDVEIMRKSKLNDEEELKGDRRRYLGDDYGANTYYYDDKKGKCLFNIEYNR